MRGLTDAAARRRLQRPPVPLHPTGTAGEFVAGVRYRAWQPPSCLHPTIPVHAPLVFDVVDTWTGRSLGGCTYHVAHPGGRSTRRSRSTPTRRRAAGCARFFAFGHTPGAIARCRPTRAHSPDLPFTLGPATTRRATRSAPWHGLAACMIGRRRPRAPARPWRLADGIAPATAGDATTRCVVGARRSCAPHWRRPARRPLEALGPRRARRGAGTRRGRLHPRERRHLQRLRRPAGHGPAVAARPRAAADLAGGVGAPRGAAWRSAPGCSTLILRRPLRPAAAAARAACCRRSSSSPTPASCGRATACACPHGRLPAPVRRGPRRARPTAQWWVLGDRTQAPSGAGYALENRIVLSRILPEAFRDCQRPAAGARSSAPCATRSAALAPQQPRQPARSCCSRRARTTRPTSSTPTSRATSASRWSRAAT